MKKITILVGLACLLSGAMQAADDPTTLGDDAFLEEVEVEADLKDEASCDSDSASADSTGKKRHNKKYIKGASYWVEEGFNGLVRQASGTHDAKLVLFFSSAGQHLKTVPRGSERKHESQLDPHAPLPQVRVCKIRYWQGKKTYRNHGQVGDSSGAKIIWDGRGRYFVCYDGNGNIIDSFPWSKKHEAVTFFMGKQEVERPLNPDAMYPCVSDFPLDLSLANKQDGNASDDERAIEGGGSCCVVQ